MGFAGAVAEQGHGSAGEGGEHQFPLLPVRHGIAAVGMDDFGEISILQRCRPSCSGHSKATPGPHISERP